MNYISISDAKKLIERREPKGMYITKDDEKYIGIDNHDGNAWTEEFDNATDCIRWLRNED